jgi:hypothetical protein
MHLFSYFKTVLMIKYKYKIVGDDQLFTCKIIHTYLDSLAYETLDFTKEYVKSGGDIDKISYDTIEISGSDEHACWLIIGEEDIVEELEKKCRDSIVEKELYGDEEEQSEEIKEILENNGYQIEYGDLLTGAPFIDKFCIK